MEIANCVACRQIDAIFSNVRDLTERNSCDNQRSLRSLNFSHALTATERCYNASKMQQRQQDPTINHSKMQQASNPDLESNPLIRPSFTTFRAVLTISVLQKNLAANSTALHLSFLKTVRSAIRWFYRVSF